MKSCYGEPIGTHQRSFERYRPRPPTASPSRRLGVLNPNLKLQSLLSQERVKVRTSNFVRTLIGSIGIHIAKFSRKFAHENLREKGARAYPGTAQIFWVPPFVSGMDKATNFKFSTRIHRIDRNKSLLKISANVVVGVLRDSKIFRAPIYRAHRAVIFAIAQLSCYLWRR